MLLLILAGSAAIIQSGSTDIEGTVSVQSGDTVIFGQTIVSLDGVVAPRGNQYCNNSEGEPYPCGAASRTALENLVRGKSVRCSVNATGNICTIDGKSLAGELLATGWAVPTRASTSRQFAALSKKAKLQKIGVWQGSFVHPQDWDVAMRSNTPVR